MRILADDGEGFCRGLRREKSRRKKNQVQVLK